MANTDRPNRPVIHRVCRQYIYSDTDVSEVAAAVYDNWDTSSSEDIAARVLDYLSTHKPHDNNWDMLSSQMDDPDPHAAQAFREIGSYKILLQLRNVEGKSISEIATYGGNLTAQQVNSVIGQVRSKFWSTYVSSEQTTLRVCRQYLYTDNKAERAAIDVCSKNAGTLSSDVPHRTVPEHLRATQRYTDTWDALSLQMQSLKAGTLDNHAQKAFDTLERADLKFLRSRITKGNALSDIAKEYGQKEKEVKAKLQNLRSKFWDVYVSSEQETLRACRRYVYADRDAVEAAIAIQRENTQVPTHPDELAENVSAYLSTTNLDTDAWDLLPARMQQQGTPIQKTVNSLQATDKALLTSRLIEGKSIEEIAEHLDLAVEVVSSRLSELRTLLWAADDTVLRECQRFIHDDIDAERIATVIYQQRTPNPEQFHEYLRNYLIKSWDPVPAWNNPYLSELITALNTPTDEPLPVIPAAAIAYNKLPETKQKLLKLKIEGASNWHISRQLLGDMPTDRVKDVADETLRLFWETFTRERWSMLPYYIEFLSTQPTYNPSHEIFKVKKEYEAGIAAYDVIGEAGQTLLKKRCIYGKSLAEIADEEQKSVEWVFHELQKLRDQFRKEFQKTLFPMPPLNHQGTVSTWEEDNEADARENFLSTYYKYIPQSYTALLRTATQWIERDRESKEGKISEAIEKEGTIDQAPTYDDDRNQVGFTTTATLGAGPEPANPEDETVNNEERRQLLARNGKLLQEALDRVKKMSMPEKKMFALVKYFLRETLDAHEGVNTLRLLLDPQESGEDGVEMLIATVTGRDMRSIRRWKNQNIRLALEEACQAVGVEFHELESQNPNIQGTDTTEERQRQR